MEIFPNRFTCRCYIRHDGLFMCNHARHMHQYNCFAFHNLSFMQTNLPVYTCVLLILD